MILKVNSKIKSDELTHSIHGTRLGESPYSTQPLTDNITKQIKDCGSHYDVYNNRYNYLRPNWGIVKRPVKLGRSSII